MNGRHTFTAAATELGGVTRDIRGDMFADTDYVVGKLPAPMYYQPDNKGHTDGYLVGGVTSIEFDENDRIAQATGYFLDGPDDPDRIRPWAAEAIKVAGEGLVAPSIDAGALEYDTETDRLLRADISGMTLVGMPAMTGTSITIIPPDDAEAEEVPAEAVPEVDDVDDVAMIAAVRSAWSEMRMAPREHEWDGDAAAQRVAASCGVEAEDADADAWSCYGSAFLYRDDDADPATRGAYKLGIVDIIDDERRLVPRAVFAVASVLEGGRGGADIPADQQEQIRDVVASIYRRMAEEFDDDTLTAPWDTDTAEETVDPGSPLGMAMVAAVTEPAPAAAFTEPDLEGYQPGYQIEGRRIFGHLAAATACHAAWTNECMGPPPTATGYAMFRRYRLATDKGEIGVGRMTSGFGQIGNGCECCDPATADDHACAYTMSLSAAIAHHDRMTTLADVAIGETDDGRIWLSGLLRDDLPEDAARVLARRVWSGDWRPAGESDELVEALALDHGRPAFTKRVQHGQHRSVVIAAAGPAPEAPGLIPFTPAEMYALARQAWETRQATEQLAATVAAADQAAAIAALNRLGATHA